MSTTDNETAEPPPRGPDILEIAPIVLRWLNELGSDRECAAELARLEAGASGHPAVREIWAQFARWPLPISSIEAIERVMKRALDDVLLEEYEWDPREREEYGLSERFAAALSHHLIGIDNPEIYLKALHARRTLEFVSDQLDNMIVSVPRSAFARIRSVLNHVDDPTVLRKTIRSLLAWAEEVA